MEEDKNELRMKLEINENDEITQEDYPDDLPNDLPAVRRDNWRILNETGGIQIFTDGAHDIEEEQWTLAIPFQDIFYKVSDGFGNTS